MKVKVNGGGAAGIGPSGTIDAWAPGEVLELDDNDENAVAWARLRVDTGFVEILEDAPKKTTARKET